MITSDAIPESISPQQEESSSWRTSALRRIAGGAHAAIRDDPTAERRNRVSVALDLAQQITFLQIS